MTCGFEAILGLLLLESFCGMIMIPDTSVGFLIWGNSQPMKVFGGWVEGLVVEALIIVTEYVDSFVLVARFCGRPQTLQSKTDCNVKMAVSKDSLFQERESQNS